MNDETDLISQINAMFDDYRAERDAKIDALRSEIMHVKTMHGLELKAAELNGQLTIMQRMLQ